MKTIGILWFKMKYDSCLSGHGAGGSDSMLQDCFFPQQWPNKRFLKMEKNNE